MILYLNIGLGANTGAEPVHDSFQIQRRTRALQWLADTFGTFSAECASGTQERLLLVEVPDNKQKWRDLDPAIFYLSREIQQDCIAAVLERTPVSLPEGRLIGPNACLWGPFDLSKFIFPSRRFA